ncbi:MAG: AMP-binding protein, partial [Gammaproteobacteria bacterium]|nr:AMP-binding protein [Gammaproteobacteria bacterium]
PGSCTLPLPGIEADIVDERGQSVTRPDAGGYLVVRKPWPAMLRTIWGNNARYLAAYWEKFNKRFYVAGDSAHRDKDGYFWIMGRIDDVLNVAGHRLGTMEIESALVSNPRVAEAAVVGKPHEIKGESVFAYVVCRGQRPTGDTSVLVGELRTWVGEHLGAIAKPDEIRFAENLPKTRSGKIMRRLLRAIARGEEIAQDVSTLENPAILDQLRGVDAPAAAARPAATRPDRPAASVNSAGSRTAAKKSASRAGTRGRNAARKRAVAKPAAKKSKAKARPSAKRKSAAVARAAKRRSSPSKTATRRGPVRRSAKPKAVRRTGRKPRAKR